MKKALKILIITGGISLVVLFCTTFWIYHPQVPTGSEVLPKEILMEKRSPDEKMTAQIVVGKKIEGFNALGTDERFYLTLQYQNARHLILRDLSEGAGSYEGGVLGLKWLDSDRVYIERIVSDRQADLIYDLTEHSWQDVKNE